jgi:hypothetical protein
MIVLGVITWVAAIAVLLAAIALAVLAMVVRRPAVALFAAVPVALGIGRVVFGIVIPAPDHFLLALAGLTAAVLGIVAGNPITVAILNYADARSGAKPSVVGAHGGIMITDKAIGADGQREVLRGGTTIGYLERLVVVAAIALGHWQIVAFLVAIKGLGRFSELDSPETRERFIIGTLVSFVWAGACAALFAL